MEPQQPSIQQSTQTPIPLQSNIGRKYSSKTLAIIGIILAWFLAPAGLIISIIALKKSQNAGSKSTLAVIGIVTNALMILLFAAIIAIIMFRSTAPRPLPVGYTEADSTAQQYVLGKARTHYVVGDTKIDHNEFKRAIKVDIPQDQQKFGMTTVLFVETVSIPEEKDSFGGIYLHDVFVLDSKGAYPLRKQDSEAWDIPLPQYDGWTEWAESIYNSPKLEEGYSYFLGL